MRTISLRTPFAAALLVLLAALACPAGEGAAPTPAPAKAQLRLQDGDVVALCGDSITSSGVYPLFLEMYQLVCGPKMKVSFVNCGRWGENAGDFPKTWDKDFVPAKPTVVTICYGMNVGRWGGALNAGTVAGEAKALRAILDKFKAGGGRVAVLGSPGCVDTEFHNKPEGANRNLAQLRDNARTVAGEAGAVFADVHSPMIEVMAKAKEKYGKEFAFAGGKGDGLHPGAAGHLVMAWVFLKALGYDGEIGTISVDLDKGQASATDGHQVLSCQGGAVEVQSSRYPFCFSGDGKSPGSTLAVADLFPFNPDLNRLTLVVRGAKTPKLKVTWGTQSKEFEAAALEKGVNLAAEFKDNPFCKPFEKVFTALGEEKNCVRWLAGEYKGNADMQKRYERALAAKVPAPVKHTIKIEAAQ